MAWFSRKNSPSLQRRVQTLEIALAELHDAYELLLASHKRLRSRTGMREYRARQDEDIPDSRVDPTGWKRAMRARQLNGKKSEG
jgi:hypothetical protein